MKTNFQQMSIQNREEAYLIVEVEEAIMDDIDYDLCLVGKFFGERVKVHDLSSGFAFENLDKSLGNIMGMLEYDAMGGRNVLHNFMRIWVRLDTREPLMRRKKLHHLKGSYFRVTFSHERIS
ncbi:hypothetical protein Gohar_023992 [Gossypium harknessii]|uniref:Uncharacterized protein n=1 Tax=Gossypium harknessii TaxID=34285 RepID=A0A7J9HEI6_9ROSI|nr:hypothetical protein [Gossypium harknessii]